jgi:ribosome biogenesis GTPase / thiamine phosphate phosphatase
MCSVKNQARLQLSEQNLERLGYSAWFEETDSATLQDGFAVARVIEVNKGNYRVSDGQHEIHAELSGKFMFDAESVSSFPTVGDWVVIQDFDNHSLAIVHQLLPRKSILKRKEAGKAVEFQLIAANIDYGLIVETANPEMNLNRLERYLVMVNDSKIQPIVILTKIDLMSAAEIATMHEQMKLLNCSYLLVSSVSEEGAAALESELEAGRTYCLLGPSGVGKTTLLNRLIGAELYRVNEIREKDGKGRHTTVSRQLISLESGSIFIDTPGMRELGNFAIADGIENTFSDISAYGMNCRFKGCTHQHEKECAILEAVEQGNIDPERYRNFIKLQKESEFYEMSYSEKRRKDRAFGKMIKNYKKTNKTR